MNERRRLDPSTPQDYLEQLSALALLDRLPVPIVAVAADGLIVHANPAFESMLGRESGTLFGESFESLLRYPPKPSEGVVRALRGSAGQLIDLCHYDDSVVRAVVSSSALMRADDPVALVAFHDVTDQLWADGRITQSPYAHGGLGGDPS